MATASDSSSGLDIIAIRALPISMLIGYVFPSIAMCLSWAHSGRSRQLAVAVWQNFPAWIAVVQEIISWLASRHATSQPGRSRHQQQFHSLSPTPGASKEQSSEALLVQAKKLSRSYTQIYRGTAIISAAMHIFGLVPIVLATICPEYLMSLSPLPLNAANLQSLQPRVFFLPPMWNSHVQISDMVEGSWNFLRYDYYIGTVAALLWAIFLQYPSFNEAAQKQNVTTRSKGGVGNIGLNQVLWILASTIVLGPGFTIASLMGRREAGIVQSLKTTATSTRQEGKIAAPKTS